jgi:hypothetical protein
VLHPVGPLPAPVYWRRRAYAAAAVLVLLVLGWVALPPGGGGGDRGPATVAATSFPSAGSEPPTSLAAAPPANDPGRTGDGGSGGTAGSGSGIGGGAESAGAATPRTTATATAVASEACPDRYLALRVEAGQPTYQVGESPRVNLTVRNVSSEACVRDVGAAQQEVVLMAKTTRLWSSNDCYPEGEKELRLLPPGGSANFSVVWSGLSSRPRCAGERVRVSAGRYQLVARLGTLVSRRAPLVLR